MPFCEDILNLIKLTKKCESPKCCGIVLVKSYRVVCFIFLKYNLISWIREINPSFYANDSV